MTFRESSDIVSILVTWEMYQNLILDIEPDSLPAMSGNWYLLTYLLVVLKDFL